uniref:Dicer-like protein n=1 Tax=Timema bartmani TaxID=61472 RepID=A0A7R9I1U5_9NEOP|nr:unnamed protein product [Timema bartmani]
MTHEVIFSESEIALSPTPAHNVERGTVSNSAGKRKRQELQEDFEEHLIPELCMQYTFPAELWLKATALPTILHRITYLLMAEELRQTLSQQIGIGEVTLPHALVSRSNGLSVNAPLGGGDYVAMKFVATVHYQLWEKLQAQCYSSLVPPTSYVYKGVRAYPPAACAPHSRPSISLAKRHHIMAELYNIFLLLTLNNAGVDWKPLQEDKALKTELESPKAPSNVRHHFGDVFAKSRGTKRDEDSFDKDQLPIDIDRETEDISPIDIMYYEEFINKPWKNESEVQHSSLASVFPIHEEITIARDSPVPTLRILEANSYGLGPEQADVLQVHDFAPISDWIPPGMCVQRTLQTFFQKAELSPHFLYDIEIPENERQEGIISQPTITNIIAKLLEKVELEEIKKVPQSSMEGFLSLRTIADKCLADSVEALIGVCLKKGSVRCKALSGQHASREDVLGNFPVSMRVEKTCWETSQSARKLRGRAGKLPAKCYRLNSLTLIRVHWIQVPPSRLGAADMTRLISFDRANGIAGALNMVKYLQVLPDTVTPNNLLYSHPRTALLGHGDMELYLKGTKVLERKLGYTFKDRSYLLQALTHPSFFRNRITDCYQRLEFLGDAILDFLITCFIYEHCGLLSPGQMTDLRSALVNNTTFAVLSVRYGFHQYILHSSSHLMDAVNRFVLMQEERCHGVNTDATLSVDMSKGFQATRDQQSGHIRLAGCKFDISALYMLTETDPLLAEAIEVPKVLGDVFESIAGAIYLDSNKSLSTVWDIYYHLMKKEIDEFSKNVPLQPVRMLYELTHSNPLFLKTEVLEDLHNVMVTLEFMNRDKKYTVFGFGENKNLAKKAAARLAIKELTESSK